MARRSCSGESDSLELLLDTICNVFGGIVFIAILVAVLSSPTVEAPKTVDRRPEREVAQLQAELQQYEQALRQMKQTQQAGNVDAAAAHISALEQLERQERSQREELERLQKWLVQVAELRKLDSQPLTKQLREIEDLLQRAHEQQRVAQLALSRRLRLPQERATSLRQAIFLVSGERIYAVACGAHDPLRARADDVVIQGSAPEWRVTPQQGRGLVAAHLAKDESFRNLLPHIPANVFFFECFVTPDGVEAFNHLRDTAVELGYSYNVSPIEMLPLQLTLSDSPMNVQ